MPDNNIYCYNDISELHKAWNEYYTQMGLAYNKLQHKVHQRCKKGKFPNKN